MDSRRRRGNRQSPLGFGATEQSAIDVEPDWWRDFFTDFYNSFASLVQSEEGTIREVGYILDCLEPPTGGHLLDVPCGTGRHSLELARRGFAVTGIELSEEAIDTARHDARERNLMITLAQRDMRDLPWDDAFDGAFCFFGSFGYFDEVENGKFLHSVCRTLKPGARFVIETHVAETLLPRFTPRGWQAVGDRILLQERHYDHESGRINCEWTLLGNQQRSVRRTSIRLYTFADLCRLASDQGFTFHSAYDTLEGEPFKLGSSRLSLVLEKPTS